MAGDIPGAKVLGLTPRHLVQASNRFLGSHPALADWRRVTAQAAIRNRESRTFKGRLRKFLTDDPKVIAREAYNHPMQGGVADIFNLTLLAILNEFPQARFCYGMHDSAKIGLAREYIGAAEPRIRELVEQPWDIHGTTVRFPATFHVRT